MKIILIGFMGSGKSSVARHLGKLLSLPVLEMDEYILQETQMQNMHELFAKGGELLLREKEIAVAQRHVSAKQLIISTGAGVVLNKIVLDYLKANGGKVFFLKALFQTIAERLAHDQTRPLFKDIREANLLYDFRQPLYMRYADQTIEVEQKSIQEIAEEIATHISK